MTKNQQKLFDEFIKLIGNRTEIEYDSETRKILSERTGFSVAKVSKLIDVLWKMDMLDVKMVSGSNGYKMYLRRIEWADAE